MKATTILFYDVRLKICRQRCGVIALSNTASFWVFSILHSLIIQFPQVEFKSSEGFNHLTLNSLDMLLGVSIFQTRLIDSDVFSHLFLLLDLTNNLYLNAKNYNESF